MRSSRCVVLVALLPLFCGPLGAQARKSFEAVVIRPESPGVRATWPTVRGARFEAPGATPVLLISQAFRIEYGRIDRPKWLDLERFSIRAILPAGTTERDVPEMLQALLVERFKLKMHIERRPYPAYELVVLASGHKLLEVAPANDLETTSTAPLDPPSKQGSDPTRADPGYKTRTLPDRTRELDAERMTMAALASELFMHTDERRPVIDKTGLTGVYQFKTILPPVRIGAAFGALLGDRVDVAPSGISLARSLAALGLKLEPSSAPADFVVVDHIERPSAD